MDVAKDVMTRAIDSLPDSSHVALRLYGHRVPAGRPGACEDSELVIPMSPIDKVALRRRVRGIQPRGTTPIAYSLQQVIADMKDQPGEKVVVLVTDGEEECRGDLVSAIAELQKAVRVRVNFVGLAIVSERVRTQLGEIAKVTGGRYYDASDASGLRAGLRAAMAAQVDVVDHAGTVVHQAVTMNAATDLRAGLYSVVVHLAQGPVTFPGIQIVPGQHTTVLMEQVGDGIKATAQTSPRRR